MGRGAFTHAGPVLGSLSLRPAVSPSRVLAGPRFCLSPPLRVLLAAQLLSPALLSVPLTRRPGLRAGSRARLPSHLTLGFLGTTLPLASTLPGCQFFYPSFFSFP